MNRMLRSTEAAGAIAYAASMPPKETRTTFWRTLQTFCVTRILIAMVLLAYVGFHSVKTGGPVAAPSMDWQAPLAYVLAAIGFALCSLYLQRQFMLQLLAQLAIDIGAISVLYVAAGGAKSGLAILYLFPLAGVAILAPLVLALFCVSIVTLILLADSGYQFLRATPDAPLSQAGLYGAAFFAAIYLLNRLAAKLIRQEDLTAKHERGLQLQEAINRMVIADMEDGILVVGRDSEVFAGNPAAERMLGLSFVPGQQRCKLSDMPLLVPIADAFSAWHRRFDDGSTLDPGAASFVMVKRGEGAGRRELVAHLKLRFATVKTDGLGEDRTIIFMQDVTEIENQAQQLKLASMGRLTASIAHEVRNPLSAISHAASLLREDVSEPTQLRLLNIVNDNVLRLNRMIEDILKLSRKAHTHNEPLKLAPFLAEFIAEFEETHTLAPGMIEVGDMRQYQIRFDPLHLREVLVNLLTNALRYASSGEGSIRIRALSPKSGRLELHIQDDGPAITPEVRSHLFEPFYTTSNKGTGLGLYVARELCLNNGAMLDYEYRMDMTRGGVDEPSGRFVITFPLHDRTSPTKH